MTKQNMQGTDILIVEDNEAMRESITQRLKSEGMKVRVATDMEEGLAQLKRGGIALLVLDLLLGQEAGRSGADLVKQARAENVDMTKMHIVVLSDWTDPASVLDGILPEEQYDYFHKSSTSLDVIARHVKKKLHG